MTRDRANRSKNVIADNTKAGIDVRNAVRRLRHESKLNRSKICVSVVCWSAAMLLLIVALRTASHSTAPQHILQGLSILLAALCCLLAGIVALPRTRNDMLAASFTLLAERPDIEAIGPLIDALDLALEAQAATIRALLITLLPRLTTADAPLLSRRQRRRLGDTLLLGDADRDADYLLAILQGLEQIGDEETLHTIRQLVQCGAVTAAQLRVLEAATVCLLSLETRLEQERSHTMLLRGAAPTESGAELLRPAHSEPNAAPNTLLRQSQLTDVQSTRLGCSVLEPESGNFSNVTRISSEAISVADHSDCWNV